MTLFDVVISLILGGSIWFFVTIVFEESVQKRIREKKFGKGSTERLAKGDMQGFYILSAVISALLGLLIGYLGIRGMLS